MSYDKDKEALFLKKDTLQIAVICLRIARIIWILILITLRRFFTEMQLTKATRKKSPITVILPVKLSHKKIHHKNIFSPSLWSQPTSDNWECLRIRLFSVSHHPRSDVLRPTHSPLHSPVSRSTWRLPSAGLARRRRWPSPRWPCRRAGNWRPGQGRWRWSCPPGSRVAHFPGCQTSRRPHWTRADCRWCPSPGSIDGWRERAKEN